MFTGSDMPFSCKKTQLRLLRTPQPAAASQFPL